jgi:hypothetical protein
VARKGGGKNVAAESGRGRYKPENKCRFLAVPMDAIGTLGMTMYGGRVEGEVRLIRRMPK